MRGDLGNRVAVDAVALGTVKRVGAPPKGVKGAVLPGCSGFG